MKLPIQIKALGFSSALAVVGWAATANAQNVGQIYTFVPNYSITEAHAAATDGAYTAGSFAMAALMGHQGWTNATPPSNWYSQLMAGSGTTNSCANRSEVTIWPSGCTPTGMASAMSALTGNTSTWATQRWSEDPQGSHVNQDQALNRIVNAIRGNQPVSSNLHQSPVIIPIYGQADHWATIKQVTAKYNSNGTWSVLQVQAWDAGPVNAFDSGWNPYEGGNRIWGSNFSSAYYKVLSAISASCDPTCSQDPYYHQWLVMWEPKPGTPVDTTQNKFDKLPGVAVAGQMNHKRATTDVFDALRLAAVDKDPQTWGVIQNAIPGEAWEVHALYPSGDQWNYYLVPLLSNTTTAVAFVQLASDTGSFEGMFVPTNPASFTPVTMSQAHQLAHDTLTLGEHLTGGLLTWDPSGDAPMQKSPSSPYYEFGIMGPGNQDAGMVRVSLNGGAQVVRSQ